MPKPVHRPANQLKIPVPGYYCPECEDLVESPPGTRPRIWHTHCLPPKGSPRRRKRICPGCGERWSLEDRPHFGNPSSFPEGHEACKDKYRDHYRQPRPPTPRQHELDPEAQFYCHRCGNLVTSIKYRRQIATRTCPDCFENQNPTKLDRESPCVICGGPRINPKGLSVRLIMCKVCTERYQYLSMATTKDTPPEKLYDHHMILEVLKDPDQMPDYVRPYYDVLGRNPAPSTPPDPEVTEEEEEDDPFA